MILRLSICKNLEFLKSNELHFHCSAQDVIWRMELSDQRHRMQSREGSDEGVWKQPSFKSDKILSIARWIYAGVAAVPHVQKLSG